MDEISSLKPPTAIAPATALKQTAEQKRVSTDTKSPPDDTPNVESLDVSEDPDSPPIARSKLRKISIILMLCVRSFQLRPQRAPID